MVPPKIEDEDLTFTCELLETILNDTGRHFLRVSLLSQAGRDKLSDVSVCVGEVGVVVQTKPTAITDTVEAKEDGAAVGFSRRKFVFTLPKGLCTDDPDQKISLLISVNKPPLQGSKGKPQKTAEGVFVIYPREIPPIPDLTKAKGKEIYAHDGLMTFTRTLKEEGIQVHAGKLRYAVRLEWTKDVEKDEEEEKKEEEVKVEEVEDPEEEKETVEEEEAEKEEVEEKEPNKEETSTPVPPSPSPVQPPPPVKEEEEKKDTGDEAEKALAMFATQNNSPHSLPPTPAGPTVRPTSVINSPAAPVPRTPASAIRNPPAARIQHWKPSRDIESARQHQVTSGRPQERFKGPGNVVAKPGYVEIEVIVHAASQLPKLSDGAIPKPYVIGRSKCKNSSTNDKYQRATHASIRPSIAPSWEELIVIEIKSSDVKKEGISLVIADQLSKSVLLEYELGLTFLKPFHQYHLDLVQSVEPDLQGSVKATHLFVSVQLKSSQLPLSGAFEYQGLEVTLCAMEASLSNPIGPLTAVARVVPDLFNYVCRICSSPRRARPVFLWNNGISMWPYMHEGELCIIDDATRQLLDNQPGSSALNPLSVQCPTPHPTSFFTLSTQSQFGYPQWTLPGLPEQHPSWNHTFVFCDHRELSSMFTDMAALVIEFYSTSTTFNGNNWSLSQCCGYCSLLLDKQVYEALISYRGSLGLRVNHISLQNNKLYTGEHKTPSVGLVLRLLTSVEPDTLVSVSDIGALPTLGTLLKHDIPISNSPPIEKMEWPYGPGTINTVTPPPVVLHPKKIARDGRANTHTRGVRKDHNQRPVQEGELPSHNALENILKLSQPSSGNSSHSSHSTGLIPTRLPPNRKTNESRRHSSGSPSSSQSDKYALSLLDAQQKEIDSYKEALKRMGEEIVRLQEEIARIEMENSKLRQRVNMHEDATKAIVDVQELDDLSRPDLIDKYVTLKHKLSAQVSESMEYRDKLLKVQNNMIKQNDREQQYLKQRDSYLKQQDELQSKQGKIKKLEKTCIEQEKALEKMEKILRNKLKNSKAAQDDKSDEMNALQLENVKLKSHVEQLRNTSSANSSSQEDAEKLRLQLHLEKSKGRVASLERELLEKARDWGKEKEVLRLRIGEQRNKHNHRSLPPLPRDRGYSYDMSDDDTDDYRSPRQHHRHRHLNPLY